MSTLNEKSAGESAGKIAEEIAEEIRYFRMNVEFCQQFISFILLWYPSFRDDVIKIEQMCKICSDLPGLNKLIEQINVVMEKSFYIIKVVRRDYEWSSDNCTHCNLLHYCDQCMYIFKQKIGEQLTKKNIECSLKEVVNNKNVSPDKINLIERYSRSCDPTSSIFD